MRSIKHKIIEAIRLELNHLEAEDGANEKHIYAIEKLLNVLKTGQDETSQEVVEEVKTIKTSEDKNTKSDSIFDF